MTTDEKPKKRRGRRPLWTNDAAILAMHDRGYSGRAIAHELMYAHSTVARRLKQLLAADEPTDDTGIVKHRPQRAGHKATRTPAKPRRPCEAPGCERDAAGNGPYCSRCRQRVRRHGDPSVVLKRGRKGQ